MLKVVDEVSTDIEVGLEAFGNFAFPSLRKYICLYPFHDTITLTLLKKQLKAQIQKHELKHIFFIVFSHVFKHFVHWILCKLGQI